MKPYKKQLSIVKEKITTTWEKSKPKIVTGVTIAGAIGTFIVVMNRLLQRPEDNFGNWLETALDEELDEEYERRLECHGNVTYEMDKINDEMVRRMNEKYEKEHPNAEVRHREHGWYLPNDD